MSLVDKPDVKVKLQIANTYDLGGQAIRWQLTTGEVLAPYYDSMQEHLKDDRQLLPRYVGILYDPGGRSGRPQFVPLQPLLKEVFGEKLQYTSSGDIFLTFLVSDMW